MQTPHQNGAGSNPAEESYYYDTTTTLRPHRKSGAAVHEADPSCVSDADLQRCTNKLIPALPVTTQLTKQLTEQHGLNRKKSFLLSQRKASVDWSNTDLPLPPPELTDGLQDDVFDGTQRRHTEPLYNEPRSPTLSRASMASPVPTYGAGEAPVHAPSSGPNKGATAGCYATLRLNSVPSSPRMGARPQHAPPMPPHIPQQPIYNEPLTPPHQSAGGCPVAAQQRLLQHNYAEVSTSYAITNQPSSHVTCGHGNYAAVANHGNYAVVPPHHGELVQVVPAAGQICSGYSTVPLSPQLHRGTHMTMSPQHRSGYAIPQQQACMSPQSPRRKTIGPESVPMQQVATVGCTSPSLHQRSASLTGTQQGSPQHLITPGSPKPRVAPPPPRRSQNTRLSMPGPGEATGGQGLSLAQNREGSLPPPSSIPTPPCRNRSASVGDGLTDPLDLPPPPAELLEGLPTRTNGTSGSAGRPPVPPKRNYEPTVTSPKLHSKTYS